MCAMDISFWWRNIRLEGVKTQWISNLSVIHRSLRRPSLFYFVCTVLSAFFANMETIVDSTKLLLSKDMDGLINLFWWLLASPIIGVILSWLFDRPHVDLVVEGGIRVGTYAGFNHSRLSALIKKWSGDRGQTTAETAGASSKYFVYVTRADKTKAVTIRRIVWLFIMYIVLFVGITMLVMGAIAAYLYIQFAAE